MPRPTMHPSYHISVCSWFISIGLLVFMLLSTGVTLYVKTILIYALNHALWNKIYLYDLKLNYHTNSLHALTSELWTHWGLYSKPADRIGAINFSCREDSDSFVLHSDILVKILNEETLLM